VGVDGGITGCAGQVLVLPVRDVEVGLRVTVLLGQTEIDNVDLVTTLADAHEEVVGLDITVDEGLGVDVLDAGDELVGQKQDGLQRELAVAEVEQVLQAGAEQVENHGIIVALSTEPADEGDADASGERLVDTGLILELGVLGLDALELDGNLLTGDDVGSEVDITEGATTNLAADAVFITDAKILPTPAMLAQDLHMKQWGASPGDVRWCKKREGRGQHGYKAVGTPEGDKLPTLQALAHSTRPAGVTRTCV
jgi:hypothetical protein